MSKPSLLILPTGDAIDPDDVTRIFADPARKGEFSSIIFPDRVFVESGHGDHRAIHHFDFESWEDAAAERNRLIAAVNVARASISTDAIDAAFQRGADSIREDCARLGEIIDVTVKKRNELRAEVERLKAELDAFENLDVREDDDDWITADTVGNHLRFPTREEAVAARRKAAGLEPTT